MLSSQLTYQVDRLPCSLPSVSVPVDVIVQLSVSANSHVNAMRCSMFSSHASSASLDSSWRSLNLSVTTGREAARHQKILLKYDPVSPKSLKHKVVFLYSDSPCAFILYIHVCTNKIKYYREQVKRQLRQHNEYTQH